MTPYAEPTLPEGHVAEWDRVAPMITGDITGARYDLLWRMLYRPEGPLLDIGCGQGRLLAKARAAGLEAVGVDISPRALAAARDGFAGDAHLGAADARYLPFRTGRFATVTLTEVIEHVPDPQMALQEVHRVLAPGGQVAITTPTSVQHVAERLRVYRSFQPYDNALALPKMVELLRECGFVKIRVRLVPISVYTFTLAYYRGRLRPDARVRGPMPKAVELSVKAVDGIMSPVLTALMAVLPRGAGEYLARMALISARRPE